MLCTGERMHELVIAQGILRAVKESLTPDQVERVTRVTVTIGELSGVQKDCLEFAYDVITEGTPLKDSALDIEYVKAIFRCKSCGAEFEPDEGFFTPCPDCGEFGAEVIQGEGLFVKRVEVG